MLIESFSIPCGTFFFFWAAANSPSFHKSVSSLCMVSQLCWMLNRPISVVFDRTHFLFSSDVQCITVLMMEEYDQFISHFSMLHFCAYFYFWVIKSLLRVVCNQTFFVVLHGIWTIFHFLLFSSIYAVCTEVFIAHSCCLIWF